MGTEEGCEEALAKYMGHTREESRAHFAVEVQGFIESEIERGLSIDMVCGLIHELLLLVRWSHEDVGHG